MTDYSKPTLDALEADLRATSPSNPVTSGELAARHFPDDSSGNPTTRAAIKHLMRSRQLPIIGVGNGYHVPQSNADVAEAVSSLQGRIDGIKERQQLIMENWAAHTTDTDADAVDTAETPDTQRASTDGGQSLTDAQLAKIDADPFLEPSDFSEIDT